MKKALKALSPGDIFTFAEERFTDIGSARRSLRYWNTV